jgi:hypothetical protein
MPNTKTPKQAAATPDATPAELARRALLKRQRELARRALLKRRRKKSHQ